jgi:hypothetical protein
MVGHNIDRWTSREAWTAVPLDWPGSAENSTGSKTRNMNRDLGQVHMYQHHLSRVVSKVHLCLIVVLLTTFLYDISFPDTDTPYLLWTRAIGVILDSALQLDLLFHLQASATETKYYIRVSLANLVVGVAVVLTGIYINERSRSVVYYNVNYCLYAIMAIMCTPNTNKQRRDPAKGWTHCLQQHNYLPTNAIFSCASSTHRWVQTIILLHPFWVLNTFLIAAAPELLTQTTGAKTFLWMACWPILILSHIWRQQVALRLSVFLNSCNDGETSVTVVVDSKTKRLAFEEVQLAYEAPFDNQMTPEYFENIFDIESSRCVIIERRNGSKHLLVCPQHPDKFIQTVNHAAAQKTG